MDNLGQGDSLDEKRRATLRGRTASLTATTGRARFNHHGGFLGEGAR